MGADFRLKDGDLYRQWYDVDHQAEELLKKAVYGLPEICLLYTSIIGAGIPIHRDHIVGILYALLKCPI